MPVFVVANPKGGAGKSTLMNVLYGLYQADEGEILLDDVVQKFAGPGDAMNAGIAVRTLELLFAVLHWVARTLELGRPGRWLLDRHPAWVLLGLPLVLAPALATVSAPHPAPEGLLPQFWALVFYAMPFGIICISCR